MVAQKPHCLAHDAYATRFFGGCIADLVRDLNLACDTTAILANTKLSRCHAPGEWREPSVRRAIWVLVSESLLAPKILVCV